MIDLSACEEFSVLAAATATCAGSFQCDISGGKLGVSPGASTRETLSATGFQRRAVLTAPQPDWPPGNKEEQCRVRVEPTCLPKWGAWRSLPEFIRTSLLSTLLRPIPRSILTLRITRTPCLSSMSAAPPSWPVQTAKLCLLMAPPRQRMPFGFSAPLSPSAPTASWWHRAHWLARPSPLGPMGRLWVEPWPKLP
jgi:hypothetical protein